MTPISHWIDRATEKLFALSLSIREVEIRCQSIDPTTLQSIRDRATVLRSYSINLFASTLGGQGEASDNLDKDAIIILREQIGQARLMNLSKNPEILQQEARLAFYDFLKAQAKVAYSQLLEAYSLANPDQEITIKEKYLLGLILAIPGLLDMPGQSSPSSSS